MNRGKGWSPLVVMAGVLVAGLMLAPPARADQLRGPVVKLGAMYAVTGVCAEWGMAAKIAGDLAVEEINAKGGIGGVPVEVVWYDYECKAGPAIPIIEKLAKQDRVLAVNGPCQSSAVEVIYPKLSRLKVICVSFCSSKPGLSALSPFGFRNTLTSDKQLDPAVRRWKERYNIKTAVVLYNSEDAVSTSEGKGIMPVLFEKYGIKLLKMYTFQSQTLDFAPYMTEIKSLNPDGIGIGSCYEAGARIAIEARRQGIKAPLVGGACLRISGDGGRAQRREARPLRRPRGGWRASRCRRRPAAARSPA